MAHRGGRHGGAPNSIDAIAHAATIGAESMEIDVNETADGVLVATHDAIAGGSGWITEQTYADLVAKDPQEWSGRRLEDVVGFALSRSTLPYLDLKSISPAGVKHVVETWPAEVEAHRIVFAAARGDVIAWIGENYGHAATSFLYYDRLLDLRSLTGYMSPTFVHPCFDFLREPFRTMTEEYVARARALGHRLVSWSENDPERIGRLAELGVDYICTDEPELAKSVVDASV